MEKKTDHLQMNISILWVSFSFFLQIHPASMIAHPATVQATVPHPQIAATPILTSPVGTNNSSATQPNAPCSTLFVANLGQFSSEQELKDLFSR